MLKLREQDLMTDIEKKPHIPVLLEEMLRYLEPKEGKTYVDCTFGAGGYSEAILKSADCNIIAIDRDPEVRHFAETLKEKYKNRFTFIPGKFSDIDTLLNEHNILTVDGFVLDLGMSSMQVDTGERGFSFLKEANLDMRMSKDGRDAAFLVNKSTEKELADIIYYYGEDKEARKIARAIVNNRLDKPITTTTELAKIIRSAVSVKKAKIDPATKTFQALRIWVNDEISEIETFLPKVDKLLNKEGRMVVVSFHSLEDQLIKQFIKSKSSKTPAVSRYLPFEQEEEIITYKALTKKATKPSLREEIFNPRSRSARLRAIEKIV